MFTEYLEKLRSSGLEYGLKEIVSFTVSANIRSIRVMEKIGLKLDLNSDFSYPELAADHPLSQNILYRLRADEYLQGVKND